MASRRAGLRIFLTEPGSNVDVPDRVPNSHPAVHLAGSVVPGWPTTHRAKLSPFGRRVSVLRRKPTRQSDKE
jgi:hypothetical protein